MKNSNKLSLKLEMFKKKIDSMKYPIFNIELNEKDYKEIEQLLAKNMFEYLSYLKTKIKKNDEHKII